MTLPLLLLALISASGLLLYTRKNIESKYLSLLMSLGAGSMLAVSLIHIFPESFERTHDAIYAFLAWFIVIYLIEELLTGRSHYHTHGDHIHEDPHSHSDHVALVSWIAISAHTLIDGVGIRAGLGLGEWVWLAILMGVAAHQIPVSLALASLLRWSHMSRSIQIMMIIGFALAAPLGYLLSDLILTWVSETIVGLSAAFAGGSLLYIATTDLLPVIHSTTRHRYLSVGAFLLWVALMSVFASHSHEEHHDDHHDEDHMEQEEIAPSPKQMEIIR
jgi:zinc and cadmium transporter